MLIYILCCGYYFHKNLCIFSPSSIDDWTIFLERFHQFDLLLEAKVIKYSLHKAVEIPTVCTIIVLDGLSDRPTRTSVNVYDRRKTFFGDCT